jgi:hypothetical protein
MSFRKEDFRGDPVSIAGLREHSMQVVSIEALPEALAHIQALVGAAVSSTQSQVAQSMS